MSAALSGVLKGTRELLERPEVGDAFRQQLEFAETLEEAFSVGSSYADSVLQVRSALGNHGLASSEMASASWDLVGRHIEVARVVLSAWEQGGRDAPGTLQHLDLAKSVQGAPQAVTEYGQAINALSESVHTHGVASWESAQAALALVEQSAEVARTITSIVDKLLTVFEPKTGGEPELEPAPPVIVETEGPVTIESNALDPSEILSGFLDGLDDSEPSSFTPEYLSGYQAGDYVRQELEAAGIHESGPALCDEIRGWPESEAGTGEPGPGKPGPSEPATDEPEADTDEPDIG